VRRRIYERDKGKEETIWEGKYENYEFLLEAISALVKHSLTYGIL
jgi:hypothetical protein